MSCRLAGSYRHESIDCIEFIYCEGQPSNFLFVDSSTRTTRSCCGSLIFDGICSQLSVTLRCPIRSSLAIRDLCCLKVLDTLVGRCISPRDSCRRWNITVPAAWPQLFSKPLFFFCNEEHDVHWMTNNQSCIQHVPTFLVFVYKCDRMFNLIFIYIYIYIFIYLFILYLFFISFFWCIYLGMYSIFTCIYTYIQSWNESSIENR